MRSLEFRINAVEQVLKNCKTGWALNYWNTVLQQLHHGRDDYDQRMRLYNKQPVTEVVQKL